MILLTLNCRGLASQPKKLAVKRLIVEQSVDVIFLQETMIEGCVLVGSLFQWILREDLGESFWVGSPANFFFRMPRP